MQPPTHTHLREYFRVPLRIPANASLERTPWVLERFKRQLISLDTKLRALNELTEMLLAQPRSLTLQHRALYVQLVHDLAFSQCMHRLCADNHTTVPPVVTEGVFLDTKHRPTMVVEAIRAVDTVLPNVERGRVVKAGRELSVVLRCPIVTVKWLTWDDGCTCELLSALPRDLPPVKQFTLRFELVHRYSHLLGNVCTATVDGFNALLRRTTKPHEGGADVPLLEYTLFTRLASDASSSGDEFDFAACVAAAPSLPLSLRSSSLLGLAVARLVERPRKRVETEEAKP